MVTLLCAATGGTRQNSALCPGSMAQGKAALSPSHPLPRVLSVILPAILYFSLPCARDSALGKGGFTVGHGRCRCFAVCPWHMANDQSPVVFVEFQTSSERQLASRNSCSSTFIFCGHDFDHGMIKILETLCIMTLPHAS